MRRTADVHTGGVGMRDRQRASGLGRLEGDASIALDHGLLHHPLRNVVPPRVRRFAHSLKRDTATEGISCRSGSPMSMTSPRTTLTRGHDAPLLHRSSAELHPTLPQHSRQVFLRRDLRLRADFFPNPSLKRRNIGGPSGTVWRYGLDLRQPGPGALLSSPA